MPPYDPYPPYIPADLSAYEPAPQKPWFPWKLTDQHLGVVIVGVVAALIVLVLLSIPVQAAMISDQVAIDATERAEYSDVEVIDKATVWGFGNSTCKGKFDDAQFTVRATGDDGFRRQMVICASFFGSETLVISSISAPLETTQPQGARRLEPAQE